MKILPVGEFKTHFSQVLEMVKQGEEIIISYGRKKENIAVVIPYTAYKERNRLRLGALEKKGKYTLREGYEMTEEEMVGQ
jgi:prevent-host-death family protein